MISKTAINKLTAIAEAEQSNIEPVGDEDNPKMGHRCYDCVKKFVEYIGRNWGPIVFILDRLCGK